MGLTTCQTRDVSLIQPCFSLFSFSPCSARYAPSLVLTIGSARALCGAITKMVNDAHENAIMLPKAHVPILPLPYEVCSDIIRT
jgi:hypothetical protein